MLSPVKSLMWCPCDYHMTLTNYTLLNNSVSLCNGGKYELLLLWFQEPSSSAPLLAQTRKLTHHALLKTVPYNSCHRKTRWVITWYESCCLYLKPYNEKHNWNYLSFFLSTKSEKVTASASSNPSDNMTSACWESGISVNTSQSNSTVCSTGKVC